MQRSLPALSIKAGAFPLYTSRGDTCKAPPSLKEGLSRTPHGSQALQDSGALGPMLLSEERPGRKHPVSVNTGPFYPKNLKKKKPTLINIPRFFGKDTASFWRWCRPPPQVLRSHLAATAWAALFHSTSQAAFALQGQWVSTIAFQNFQDVYLISQHTQYVFRRPHPCSWAPWGTRILSFIHRAWRMDRKTKWSVQFPKTSKWNYRSSE